MSGRSRGGKRKKSNSNNKGGKKKLDPVKFWGDHDTLPSPEGFETTTPDPVAVVNSLGQPPLPGHGAASPHYFKLVYTRATQLAGALAMAGEIDVLAPLEPPEPEAPAEPGNEADNEPDEDDQLGEAGDELAEAGDELAEASADDEDAGSVSGGEQE